MTDGSHIPSAIRSKEKEHAASCRCSSVESPSPKFPMAANGDRFVRRAVTDKFRVFWPSSLPSHRCIFPTFLMFGTMLFVSYSELAMFRGAAQKDIVPGYFYASEPLKLSPKKVAIWIPHTESCDGTFAAYSEASKTEHGQNTPDLLLREATVDYRHLSMREYRQRRNEAKSFRRVLVHVSAVPKLCHTLVSGPLLRDGNPSQHTADVIFPDGSLSNKLHARVDFFIPDSQTCAQWCHLDDKCASYATRCRVKEWQIIVTIEPRMKAVEESTLGLYLQEAVAEGAALKLRMPLQMRSGGSETFTMQIGFSCIAGMTARTSIPVSPSFPERSTECEKARGAVAISGGPLFGPHLHDPASWRRIAHFAVRSLFGDMWLDTVAVGVHPVLTLSEIHDRCRSVGKPPVRAKCIQSSHNINLGHLQAIAREIESEFVELEIPQKEWSRLILFPICRLGSDHRGHELGRPCLHSHHGGQRVVAHIGYTMFAPSHAWAVNLDADEFMVDESFGSGKVDRGGSVDWLFGRALKLGSAYERLEAVKAVTRETSLTMPWFDFRVKPQNERNLVQHVMQADTIAVRGFDDWAGGDFNRSHCYTRENHGVNKFWNGGKIAQHCMDGLSFMVHDPFNLKEADDKLDLSKVNCPKRDWSGKPPKIPIYTYHSRLHETRSSKCEYVSRPIV